MRKIQFPFCILDVIQRKGVRVLYIIIPIVVLLLIFLFAGYVKAPPNKAAIITGLSKNPRVLLGKSGFKVPFFERVDWLEVGQININVVTEDYIPTKDSVESVRNAGFTPGARSNLGEMRRFSPGVRSDFVKTIVPGLIKICTFAQK